MRARAVSILRLLDFLVAWSVQDHHACSESEVCLCCPEDMYVADDLTQAIFSADCILAGRRSQTSQPHCNGERPKAIRISQRELEGDILSAVEVQKAFMEDANTTKPLESVLRGSAETKAKAGADLAEVNAELEAALGLLSNDHLGSLWAIRELARRFHAFLFQYFQVKYSKNATKILQEVQDFFMEDVGLLYANGAFHPTLQNLKDVLYLNGNLRELLWLGSHAWPISGKMSALLSDVMNMYGWSNQTGEFLGGKPGETDWVESTWLNVTEVKTRHEALWRCHQGFEECVKSYGHIGMSKSGWVPVMKSDFLGRNASHVRVRRGKFRKELVLGPLTKAALPKLGLPELTTRECEWLTKHPKFSGAAPCQNESEPIQWPIGGKLWKLLDSEEARPGPSRRTFLSKLRALKLPVSAGPSGSSDTIFHFAKMFGFGSPSDLELIRLAVAGAFVPYNFHSWAEIGIASQPFGMAFRLLQPFDDILPSRSPHLSETSLTEKDGMFATRVDPKEANWAMGNDFIDLLLKKRLEMRSSMVSAQWFYFEIVRPVEHLTLTVNGYPFSHAGQPVMSNELLEYNFGVDGIHAAEYFSGSFEALQDGICERTNPLVSVVLKRAVCTNTFKTRATLKQGRDIQPKSWPTLASLINIVIFLATICGAILLVAKYKNAHRTSAQTDGVELTPNSS